MYNDYRPESAIQIRYVSDSPRSPSHHNSHHSPHSQIVEPAFNDLMDSNKATEEHVTLKSSMSPINKLQMNRSPRESEYIVIKGEVVFDSGFVYE